MKKKKTCSCKNKAASKPQAETKRALHAGNACAQRALSDTSAPKGHAGSDKLCKKSCTDAVKQTLPSTPVWDFVRAYAASGTARLHMPGHKGHPFLGFETFDLTEITDADSLYEADGILLESEEHASNLFGSGLTLYATEGSSQCIRAMLFLALTAWQQKNQIETKKTDINTAARPTIVAARNAHKAFLYAAALLDFHIAWLWQASSEEMPSSVCSCPIQASRLDAFLSGLSEPPAAVYITSPDYLGGEADLCALSAVCHKHSTLLLVDNAHGAYLHFLPTPRHPLDCGADLCCDSAHKTLPVLTGGAYLQLSRAFLNQFASPAAAREAAKQALALFGSTSPSYLILSALDCCNRYLADGYRQKLAACIERLHALREQIAQLGFRVLPSDPLRLSLCIPKQALILKKALTSAGIECEYADCDYLVCMATPENTERDFSRLETALSQLAAQFSAAVQNSFPAAFAPLPKTKPVQLLSIRQAIFAPHETLPVRQSLGRICAAPTVSCPPAIPILMPGEQIGEEALSLFAYYGIETVDVIAAGFSS